MPTPEKPELDYSYTSFQEAQGNNTFPGTQLDNDLANLKQAIDETIDFAAIAIRDDGKLQNGIVTKNSLAEDVLLGVPAPRPWVTATAYAVDDTATINNSLYICAIAHTSGVFSSDLAFGRWVLLIEFTVPAAILDGSVTEPKHATGGVSTRALADGAVKAAKVPDNEFPASKLTAAAQAMLTPIGISAGFDGVFPPPGWAFKNGQELSRATYSALFAVLCPAIVGSVSNGSPTVSGLAVDLRNLGLVGAKVEGPGVQTGTTIAGVTATTITLSLNATSSVAGAQLRLFPHGNGNGSTTFNLPDDRDRAEIGRGDMGGTAAGRVTTSGAGNSGLDTSKLGVGGGVDRHALTPEQGPVHAHTASSSVSDPGHSHSAGGSGNFVQRVAGAGSDGAPGAPANLVSISNTAVSETGISVSTTVNASGSGEAHPNVQPSRVTNKIIFHGVV